MDALLHIILEIMTSGCYNCAHMALGSVFGGTIILAWLELHILE